MLIQSIHVELAGVPNNMEFLSLQCSHAPHDRYNNMDKNIMADLYAKSGDKVVYPKSLKPS